jgi:hypothetical protein
MTNDEINVEARMTKRSPMPSLRISSFLRHSAFGIRHSAFVIFRLSISGQVAQGALGHRQPQKLRQGKL